MGDVGSKHMCMLVCRSFKGHAGEETGNTFQNGAKTGWYGKVQVSNASEGRGMADCLTLDHASLLFTWWLPQLTSSCHKHKSWLTGSDLFYNVSGHIASFASESFPVHCAYCGCISILTALIFMQ